MILVSSPHAEVNLSSSSPTVSADACQLGDPAMTGRSSLNDAKIVLAGNKSTMMSTSSCAILCLNPNLKGDIYVIRE